MSTNVGFSPFKFSIRHLTGGPIAEVIDCPLVLQPNATALQTFQLILSVDTEYVTNRDVKNKAGKSVKGNTILSYQYSAVFRTADGRLLYCEGIIYAKAGRRLKYTEILARILKRFGIGYRRAAKMKILSLAHHGTAEWAAFEDRMDYVPFVQAVRGVPITLRPMTVSLSFPGGHAAEVIITWRDTRLLTPGGKGLKEAAQVTQHKKLVLNPDPEKEKEWIANMDWVLQEHPELFAEYAINDCRVCLEYAVQFCSVFENLTKVTDLPTTIGGSTVKAYICWLSEKSRLTYEDVFGWQLVDVTDKHGRLKKNHPVHRPARAFSEVIASQGYYGGNNQANCVGLDRENGYIYLDVDITGAYPTALALLYAVDWRQSAVLIDGFDWQAMYDIEEQRGNHIAIAIAHIEFEFPIGAKHACLPVPTAIGLVYPRSGATTATGPEIAEALRQGAKVKILEGRYFKAAMNANFETELAFANYLAILSTERLKYDSNTLENMLLKELGNSFYGKLAQGLVHRTMRNLVGESDRLQPSKITCPIYAAMCTGSVRAALCAMVATAEDFPGVSVLSATTDGFMLKLPFHGEIQTNEKGKLVLPHLRDVAPDLYAKLNELPPVRALRLGRLNLGADPEKWLETKHIGDEALTIKTRGYILRWKGKTTFMARCGHQVADAEALEELYYADTIEQLEVKSLASLQAIAVGEQVDLVSITQTRRANADFDLKRVLLPDGSTRLPETIEEVMANRRASEVVRRTGRRATFESIELAKAGIKQTGGTTATIRRQIIRAVARNIGGWRPKTGTDVHLAQLLGVSENDFKNAKRRTFQPMPLTDSKLFTGMVMEYAKKLGLRYRKSLKAALVGEKVF